MLGLLTGGRFKAESGSAWDWAVAVGGLVLFAPFVIFMVVLAWCRVVMGGTTGRI